MSVRDWSSRRKVRVSLSRPWVKDVSAQRGKRKGDRGEKAANTRHVRHQVSNVGYCR